MSKRRAARRAWMHKKDAECRRLVDAEKAQRKLAVERVREEYTRMLPPADDEQVFYPQGRPEHTHLNVAARYSRHGRLEEFDFRSEDYLRFMPLKVYTLIAKQYALKLPCGQTICWFGWELGR